MQAADVCVTRPTAEAHQKSIWHPIVTILGVAIVAAAVANFVLFAVFLDRTMILRPFTDMIDWIDRYLQTRQHGDVLGYLWAPHNEHHLVFIRALTALDVAAFKASGVPFVVSATLATIVTAFIIYVEFRRTLTGPLRVLAWLSPMLLLNTAVAVDCSAPTNSVYPISVVFLVGTLVLFSSAAEFAPHTGAKRTVALVTGLLASLSNALGLLIWPAMLWLAWRGGASKRWLIGVGAIGIGYGLFYVWTLHGQTSTIDLGHLPKMADYLLAYLGLPFSRVPEFGLAARALGAALLAVAAIAILCDAILRGPATRLHLIGIGLIIVALGAALLTAIGRVDQEQEVQVPFRYGIFVALLHIGLLALVLPFFARLATTPQLQITLLGAGTAFAGMLLLMQIVSGRHAMVVSTSITNAIARYEETRVLEPGMERLFSNLPQADRVLTEIHNLGN